MNQATLDFIARNVDADVRQLALRSVDTDGVDLPAALDQIAGRQTARRKLPSWAAVDGIVYPPRLSMEQCSSELTARYKAGVAGTGRRLVDLTGGFGVDFAFMASHFTDAVYVERQQHLCAIARENFRRLELKADVVCGDAADYLSTMAPADVIFLDPARRDDHGQRTYGIADCTPNLLDLLPLLLQKARRIMVKLSPMLDWRKAVSDINSVIATAANVVREVHIVSVNNECKELLLLVDNGEWRVEGREQSVQTDYLLRCINVLSDATVQQFSVTMTESLHQQPFASLPGQFLFEPNTSIMKAGCFDALADAYGVSQLAPNSHLFTADRPIADFPGRRFHIDAVSTMNKRELKESLAGVEQANITVRNFPLTVAQLRQRLKLSEGGSTYILATTLADKRHVLLLCSKLS